MTKPNNKSTVKEMKDYIRKNKLNHPEVKLSMRKAEMIAGLKKIGHFEDTGEAPKKKAAPKKKEAPKKEPPKKEAPKKEAPKKEPPKKEPPKKATKSNLVPKINKLKKAQIDEVILQLSGTFVTRELSIPMSREFLKGILNNNFVLKKNPTKDELDALPIYFERVFYNYKGILVKSDNENKSQEFFRNKLSSLLNPKKEAPKPKFRIDPTKNPKTTPSQIKMSYKPELNTKKIEVKKVANVKPQMIDILMNLDIDVSNKIGDAVEIRKLLKDLTRDQVANVYRKIYKERNPGYKITLRKGRDKETLIKDLLELNPKIEEISAKPNKQAGKGNKVYLEVWTDEDDWFKTEGWKLNEAYPSGLIQFTQFLTKQEGFEMKKMLDEMIGDNYRLYYLTKSGTKMIYKDF